MRDEALPRGGRRAPAPPPALHDEVTRARLLEQIGRRFSVPLTTVVAGAGFGKSTLLAQAMRANRADPCGIDAWVSCEPGDVDAEHLTHAVLAALGRHSDRRDPSQRVLDALGQLAPLDVCVVFDDVHEVAEGSSGATLLAELVRALPPHVHLVLAGRRPAPVPLARLRAAGRVVDLGVGDLAFTDAEATALADMVGYESNPADLVALAGWPSLVRLQLSAPAGTAPQLVLDGIVGALPQSERRALLALGTLGWGTPADVEAVAGGPVDLVRLADTVPLIHRDDDGWYGVHNVWEDAVERIFPEVDLSGQRQRALELFQQRGETLRTGWAALRWGATDALRAAALHLVRDTFGALPIDSAERWLAAAPAAAKRTPELRLLDLALRQARRHDDPDLGEEIDVVVAQFTSVGANDGAAVALGLGALVAHTCGDEAHLLAIDAQARRLAAADDQPMLRFLAGMMTAAVASLRGDADGAAAAIAGLSFDEIPNVMTEFETRLHVNMLGMAGRADEAVKVAAPLLNSPSPYVRTIPAHARWLAGDPSGFAGGLAVDPGAGTNDRYHFYHATNGTAVAASFGDRATVEALRPVIEKFAAGTVDSRDRAMIAFATAVRHVTDHDDAAARRTIVDYADAHDERDGLAELYIRRILAVAYVCDARIRARWHAADLGPSHIRQRSVADALLAARAGQLGRTQHLADADLVFTALPLPWSVELACRAVVAGNIGARRLAVGLADLAPAAVRAELDHAATHGDEALRTGARALLDALPDPSRPTVEIRVLGELEVAVGDEVVAVADLRRRRVRALLELLVLAGPLRRDRLADLMWPDLDGLAAGRNLRVTLSRVRSVLEPGRVSGANCSALRIEGESVALAPPPCVDVDVWQFRRDVEEADVAARNDDPAGIVAALERATARWRGDPFPDVEVCGDVASAVEEVRRALGDTVLRLGELLLVAGRFDDAAAWAERVTRASPYDERAHRLAIAAQLQRRDREGVGAAITAARAMLDVLGVEPEPGTRMLFRQAEDHLQRFGPAA